MIKPMHVISNEPKTRKIGALSSSNELLDASILSVDFLLCSQRPDLLQRCGVNVTEAGVEGSAIRKDKLSCTSLIRAPQNASALPRLLETCLPGIPRESERERERGVKSERERDSERGRKRGRGRESMGQCTMTT